MLIFSVKEVKVDQNISEKKITASLPPVHAQPKPPAPVRKIVDSKPAVYVELKRTAEIQVSYNNLASCSPSPCHRREKRKFKETKKILESNL